MCDRVRKSLLQACILGLRPQLLNLSSSLTLGQALLDFHHQLPSRHVLGVELRDPEQDLPRLGKFFRTDQALSLLKHIEDLVILDLLGDACNLCGHLLRTRESVGRLLGQRSRQNGVNIWRIGTHIRGQRRVWFVQHLLNCAVILAFKR
jgi:hypothetical protein